VLLEVHDEILGEAWTNERLRLLKAVIQVQILVHLQIVNMQLLRCGVDLLVVELVEWNWGKWSSE
jgi:hypothetical protein